MHAEKKWVVSGFVIIAVAIAVIFGISLLRDTQRFQKAQASGASMEDVDSLKDLAAALKNPDTRRQALESLTQSEGDRAVDLLTALAYKSREPEVRAAALTALGQIGDLRGLQILTAGARDGDVAVRLAAVRSLGMLTNETAALTIAQTAANDIDLEVRKAAAAVLAEGPGYDVTVDTLVDRMLAEEDAEARVLIAAAMAKLESETARKSLVLALQKDEEPSVRLSALKSLDAIDDDYRVKGVACAIGDVDETVRGEAKQIFGELGPDALPAVTDALASPELVSVIARMEGVHADILQVVAGMKTAEAAEPLFLLLDLAVEPSDRVKPREAIRDEAIAALSGLGEAALPPVVDHVFQPGVRWPLKLAASRVLAGVGAAAVEPLRTYVTSRIALPSTEEAQLWIETLKTIGGPEATTLIDTVKQHDPDVVFQKLAAQPAAATTGRPPAPQLEEYHLLMYGGIYGGNPPSAFVKRKSNLPFVKEATAEREVQKYVPTSRNNISFELSRTADGWQRALAHHLTFNNAVSFAKVTNAVITADSMALGLRLAVQRDPYLMGGYGEYTVALTSEDGETYRGTYKGIYRGVPIEGAAVCTRMPARRALRAGFTPVQPGEHPRILFRKSELAALRAKLKTPFGQTAFRRLADAGTIADGVSARHVSLGLMYQLTGDERYAQEAIAITRQQMAQKDFGFMGLGQVWGPRWTNIAMTYDLCYDAWPEDVRREVRKYIQLGSFAGAVRMETFSSAANNHPCSNYFSPICGGAAMLALAYWMDPGPPPQQPAGFKMIEADALTGQPPAGVPVVPLVPNQGPTAWVWSGLVPSADRSDALVDALGDLSADPIVEGRTVTVDGQTYTFGPVDPRYISGGSVYPWPTMIADDPEATGAGMLLYTILENHRPGYYQVRLPAQGDSTLLIGDTVLLNGAYVHLGEGLFSLLLSYVGDREMQSGVAPAFKFITGSREEMQVLIDEGKEKEKEKQLLYELALEDHETTGMVGDLINTFYTSIVNMFRSHRFLMGTGGYQAEGEIYTHTAITPLQYGMACWNVFGQTLTPYMDVAAFPTRYVATGVLVPRGGNRGSRYSLEHQAFNGGGGFSHGVRFICTGFPMIAEEYKPAVLWVWNKMKGVEVDKPETFANLFEDEDAMNVIYTFVNYPLDGNTGTTTIKPVHPRERIPKTWTAPTKGLYVFRNAWEDQNDIVFQAYANTLNTHGNMGPDAAGLRLMGLGYRWTHEGEGKKAGDWGNNAPLIVEDGKIQAVFRAPGKILAYEGREDGSGLLSIDMDLIYSPRKGVGPDRGGDWPLEPCAPGSITGVRAVAVDYSGKSGAPALIALVDKIEGGGERNWVWHLQDRGERRVETGNNTFTVYQGDASLHATFVSTADRNVRTNGVLNLIPDASALKKKGYKESDGPPEPEEVVFDLMATAPAGESFFVVMTLQQGGPPPEVRRVSGDGLNTVVQVGAQRVRFDGVKAVIEDI